LLLFPLFEPERPGGRPCGVNVVLEHVGVHMGTNPVTSPLPFGRICNETVIFGVGRDVARGRRPSKCLPSGSLPTSRQTAGSILRAYRGRWVIATVHRQES
jgi:hypothetical protein